MTGGEQQDEDPLGAIRRLHKRGVDATSGGQPVVGAKHLHHALSLLTRRTDAGSPAAARLRARVLISLDLAEAERGRPEAAFTLFDEVAVLLPAAEHGVLLQQRGLVLLRLGRHAEGLGLLDTAVPLLEKSNDVAVLTPTLLNRALIHIQVGRIAAAREDLQRCTRLATRYGFDLIAAKAVHNGGLCDLLSGNIPAALAAYDAAAAVYARSSPGFLPILAVNRARAMLSAGLALDAGRELDGALHHFERQRLTQDHAEAALARAQVALYTGDLVGARTWADTAAGRFRARKNLTWAYLAALTRIRVDLADGATSRLATRAQNLSRLLREAELSHDADLASMLAVRGLTREAKVRRARQIARTLAPPRAGAPLQNRLIWRLTQAELSLAEGRRPAALSQLRSGLALLHDRRSRLGSLDLQISTAGLGVELAAIGLDTGWQAGSTHLIYAWSERARAQAFRVKPVRPPAEPRTVQALAELRQLRQLARLAELHGRPDPALQARCTLLERGILAEGRHAPGTGHSSGMASLDALKGGLARAGKTLVSILGREGVLHAIVINSDRVSTVRLCDAATAREAQRQLLGDLDTLASRRLPARMHAVVRGSAVHRLSVLNQELIRPLIPLIQTDELILVPPTSLAAVPWGLLPDLRGRAITVAPSATSWLTAQQAATPERTGPAGKQTVLVAGPRLSHAEPEIRSIAPRYPGAETLCGDGATVPAVLQALERASLTHIAAHGHHQRDNVLFSHLELADGPLMAYDVYGLASPPAHVVLSACDVGRTVAHPGEELLGFTTALLLAGTTTVIASVAQVPDDGAIQVMAAYHDQLCRGVAPAQALATASLTTQFAPFICFGAG